MDGRIPIGITFSHTHARTLGVDPVRALDQFAQYGFSRIRLCTYWNRVEPAPGTYDFSEMQRLLSVCESAGQPVVMTLGVKAPRWPEYYWPSHAGNDSPDDSAVQSRILDLVARTVGACARFSCITHWQPENEALDESGPDALDVPAEFLAREVGLVRSLDPRPIVVSAWGNDALSRGTIPHIAPLADVVGIDLYYRQYMRTVMGRPVYGEPRQDDRVLADALRATGKPVWVTELQAEPWEADDAGYRSPSPGSITPALILRNAGRAGRLPVSEIHLWGAEYWLWAEGQGNHGYLDAVRSLVVRGQ